MMMVKVVYTPLKTRTHTHTHLVSPGMDIIGCSSGIGMINTPPERRTATESVTNDDHMRTTTHVIHMGDFGKDLDDEVATNTILGLVSQNVKLVGVVANLFDERKRAQLIRTQLDYHGCSAIPVGIGTHGGDLVMNSPQDYEHATNYPIVNPSRTGLIHQDGETLVLSLLQSAARRRHRVTLLCTSALTDLYSLLREHPTEVKAVVTLVVLQGGATVVEGAECLQPDDDAANNVFDRPSARGAYQILQELGIPMFIVTRHAAAACKFSYAIYDRAARTGNALGVRLQAVASDSLHHLHTRVGMVAGDPRREGLPERCDFAWFHRTFLASAGDVTPDTPFDVIWKHPNLLFQLYDPIAALAVQPALRQTLFRPRWHRVGATWHAIVGVSEQNHSEVVPSLVYLRMYQFLIVFCFFCDPPTSVVMYPPPHTDNRTTSAWNQ
jgi:inosine-uridine nucleoside N-ribohydrolase